MDASLLEKDQSPPRFSRRTKLLVGGAFALVGLGCVAGPRVWHYTNGAPVGLHPMKMDADFDFGSPDCFKFTGGTCNVNECAAKRHATCKGAFMSHYCACDSDLSQGCVGADGNCWANVTLYKKIASSIRLENVKYSGEYIYCPSDWYKNQLRVDTKDAQKDANTWTIYRVPGKMWNTNGKTGYMIQNDKFPEYAAGVWINKLMYVSPVAGSSYEVRVMNAKTASFDPTVYMQQICKNSDGSIRIDGITSAALMYGASWSIHHFSWVVVGWFLSDPGPAGYWKPDPPLPQSVMDSFEHC